MPEKWAPYRHGYWRWIEPWGWTWIDDAPWGQSCPKAKDQGRPSNLPAAVVAAIGLLVGGMLLLAGVLLMPVQFGRPVIGGLMDFLEVKAVSGW